MTCKGDFCHKRSIKCSPATDDPLKRCQNCADFDVPCTFDRPSKLRGGARSQGRAQSGDDVLSDQQGQSLNQPISEPGAPQIQTVQRRRLESSSRGTLETLYPESGESFSSNDISVQRSWGAFAIAAQSTIRKLLDVYFEIVYPMYAFDMSALH